MLLAELSKSFKYKQSTNFEIISSNWLPRVLPFFISILKPSFSFQYTQITARAKGKLQIKISHSSKKIIINREASRLSSQRKLN
jgi:hypothetical protein